jgi:hypothetical protein
VLSHWRLRVLPKTSARAASCLSSQENGTRTPGLRFAAISLYPSNSLVNRFAKMREQQNPRTFLTGQRVLRDRADLRQTFLDLFNSVKRKEDPLVSNKELRHSSLMPSSTWQTTPFSVGTCSRRMARTGVRGDWWHLAGTSHPAPTDPLLDGPTFGVDQKLDGIRHICPRMDRGRPARKLFDSNPRSDPTIGCQFVVIEYFPWTP